jgi:hypothetical protein
VIGSAADMSIAATRCPNAPRQGAQLTDEGTPALGAKLRYSWGFHFGGLSNSNLTAGEMGVPAPSDGE